MNPPLKVSVIGVITHVLISVIMIVALLGRDVQAGEPVLAVVLWSLLQALIAAGMLPGAIGLMPSRRRWLWAILATLLASVASVGFLLLVVWVFWALAAIWVGTTLGMLGILGQLLVLVWLGPEPPERSFKGLDFAGAVILLMLVPVAAFCVAVVFVLILFLALIPLASFFSGDWQRILIPHTYVGELNVVYNQPCGIDPPREWGRTTLTVPPDGILILTLAPPEPRNREFYTVAPDGTRIRVRPLPESKLNRKPGAIYIRTEDGHSLPGRMPDGSFSRKSPQAIHYDYIFVHNEAAERSGQALRRRPDTPQGDAIRAAVRECRARFASKLNGPGP